MTKEDACEGYKDGYCTYFKKTNQRCTVPKSAREMFGKMKWCKPVEDAFGGKA